MIGMALAICFGLTGCDREPPVISGLDGAIELDCGTELNLPDYLNQNVEITDETDDGTVNYQLSDLEYTIKCDESLYDAETGNFNTEKYGSYDVELAVKDESNNEATATFTVKLNPLHLNSSIEDVVELDCKTPFNLKDYLGTNVKIENLSEDAEFHLTDFDYTVDCADTVYDSASGEFSTDKIGEYDIALTINSESLEVNTMNFTIKFLPLEVNSSAEDDVEIDDAMDDETSSNDDDDYLDENVNPWAIEKGYYVYESNFSSSGYDYLGFCEYKNTSAEDLEVTSIEFQFFDKDGVMIGSSDFPEYSRDYVASGESGYALDTFASSGSSISSVDEVADVVVNIEYEKPSGEDQTSLEVGEMEITNNYDYNVSGFAGTTVVTNPYDKDVEYFELLAGLYDEEGKLIGVMESMDSNSVNALSKARATASWLPDSREIPDQVKTLRASARVTSFADE